jgi:uncharacterized peroxidase-related enzyme
MDKDSETLPQLQKISKLPVPETDSLDEDIKKYMQVCEEKLGLVPNVIRAKALRQGSLRTFISKYNQLMLSDDSGLSRLEREMVAVVVSCHNHCVYCITSHSQAVREISGDPVFGDILMTNYRELNLSDRHRMMLDFTWKMTATPWNIGDSDRQSLYDVGFSYEDVYDIIDTVAYFNYTNRMTHGLGMLPNKEYFGMNREQKNSSNTNKKAE